MTGSAGGLPRGRGRRGFLVRTPAAGAFRAARQGPRGAEGARVRPPHGQDRRRGLRGVCRAAAQGGRGGDEGARALGAACTGARGESGRPCLTVLTVGTPPRTAAASVRNAGGL